MKIGKCSKINLIRAIGILSILLGCVLVKIGMPTFGIIVICIEILMLVYSEFYHYVIVNGEFKISFNIGFGNFFYISAEKIQENTVYIQVGIMRIQ